MKAAEAYGADGILVLPPSVTPANDDGLVDYYRAVAASTKLGIVLFPRSPPRYDVSDACLQFQRRSASLAFERSPTSWVMKDEHGDMKQFVRQWRAASDRLELLCWVG